jgi:hypothetical protein
MNSFTLKLKKLRKEVFCDFLAKRISLEVNEKLLHKLDYVISEKEIQEVRQELNAATAGK